MAAHMQLDIWKDSEVNEKLLSAVNPACAVPKGHASRRVGVRDA
jgi:hypothetical protein